MRLGDGDSLEAKHIRIPKKGQVLMGPGVVRILKQDCSWSSVPRKADVTWRGARP